MSEELVVAGSFPAVRERFTRFVRDGWLTDASVRAHAEGLVGLTRVGPFGAVLGASKLVQVRAAEPVPRPDRVVLPVRWEATGVMGRLFPVLDADLRLAPADTADSTLLGLSGAYRPPFAGLGSSLDRLVLHRAATATIHCLLLRVAAALAGPGATRTVPAVEPPAAAATAVVAAASPIVPPQAVEPTAPAEGCCASGAGADGWDGDGTALGGPAGAGHEPQPPTAGRRERSSSAGAQI